VLISSDTVSMAVRELVVSPILLTISFGSDIGCFATKL
jgi:hypothetical protein